MKRFVFKCFFGLSACLLINGCSTVSHMEYPPLEQLPDAQKFVWVTSKGVDQGEALVERLKNGRNIQALVVLPQTAEKSSVLLDPVNTRVYWNETPLDAVVYYKKRDFALLFVFPDAELMQGTKGQLSVQMAYTGYSGTLPVGEIELDLTGVEFEVVDSGKRYCTIKDKEDNPVEGAVLFGQRLKDLMRKSDGEGRVYLDAATRNTPGPHYVWKEGYWTTELDPLIEPVAVLTRKSQSNSESVSFVVEDTEGGAVSPVLFYVDNQEYVYSDDNREKLTVRDFDTTTVRVMSAGYEGETVQVEPGSSEIVVELSAVN